MRKPIGLQAGGWARRALFGGTLASVALACGCQTATGTGALAGGAIGAGLGGLLGGRHSGAAALAGGAIGAGVGGLTGAAVDANRERKAAAEVARRAPTLEDVVRMTHENVPDSEIVTQIQTSGAVYQLTADQIIYLTQNGVHQPVVSALQGTAYRPARAVYVAPPPPVYVVEPAPPPPPVGVGIGFSYHR
jgi:hypothetical protein